MNKPTEIVSHFLDSHATLENQLHLSKIPPPTPLDNISGMRQPFPTQFFLIFNLLGDTHIDATDVGVNNC